MRLTSYQENILWIIMLLAIACVAAPARAPAAATQAQSAVVRVTPPQHQRFTGGTAAKQSPAGNPTSEANSNSVHAECHVETASIIPESGSLLPVAALVGFSCLVGGIVCGAMKTRP